MSDSAAVAPLPSSLWVYLDGERIGTLHSSEPLGFSYAPAWLAQTDPPTLHPAIPIGDQRIATPAVLAFFENLLPEGEQRRLLSLKHKVSTVFGLLAIIGGDTAGAVVLTPEDQSPQSATYQCLTWEEVELLLHVSNKTAKARLALETAALEMPTPRISISGAQKKMLLALSADGDPLRPMGSTPSTHILKPDIVRTDIAIFASAVNEAIVMRAASLCHLPTAAVSYQAITHACLIERYDRTRRPDGSLGRIWQADFCQMLGFPSTIKYEYDGGPTFKTCFDLLQISAKPGVDRLALLKWLFFNLYVGNDDSHAKNISLIMREDGLRLAPFYDMMSTRVYSGLAAGFAFSIGGESTPSKINATHIAQMAKDLGVVPRLLADIARDMAAAVTKAIPLATQQIVPQGAHAESVMAQRLEHKISTIVKQMMKQIL